REQLQQKRLELRVRLVDLVDKQNARLFRRNSLEQRPRQDEPLRKEHLILARDPIDRLRQPLRSRQDLADLVLENLRVQKLLGVFPFIERLALIQPFVALKPNQVLAERRRQHLRKVGFAHARRPLNKDRFLERTRQVDDGRDSPARNIIVLGEPLDNFVDR